VRIEADETGAWFRVDGREMGLWSPEAFEALSQLWLKVGWQLKQPYSFTWMGRPLIQLPEDMLRVQEVIWNSRPDVVVETGVAHGGGLLFYAALLKALGRGRVIGVDIEIRPKNRAAIESHELAPLVTLVEGDSTAPETIAGVLARVRPGESAFVVLDSNHSKQHVLRELNAYQSIVGVGSYMVATDGSMEFLCDVPRGKASWKEDNPKAAAIEFASRHPEFILEEPAFRFNEGLVRRAVTHWPSAYLRRAGR